MRVRVFQPRWSDDQPRFTESWAIRGDDEPTGFTLAAAFDVAAMSASEAAEVAFAVCNSYPNEMFCDARYAAVVADYRAGMHRSMSVGDVVEVDGVAFVCSVVGFKPIERAMPDV